MDDSRFDSLAKGLAARRSRRQALKSLLGGAAGGAAAVVGAGPVLAKEKDQKKPDCCPASHPVLCNLTCVDPAVAFASDPQNCGGCGIACGGGQTCENGTCVSPALFCPTAACDDGIDCTVDSCDEERDACVHTPDDTLCTGGNECLTYACDPAQGCTATPKAAGTLCSSGTCDGAGSCVATSTCSDGTKNGDETDIDCGGSCPKCADGKSCAVHGDCASGVCDGNVCAQCPSGRTPCGATCIAVNEECDTGQFGICAAGTVQCVNDQPTCVRTNAPQPETCNGLDDDCDGEIDDNVVCDPVSNATSFCADGSCAFTCNAGFADCNGDAADGCETDLQTNVNHCGACNRPCSAGQACVSGTCVVIA